MACCISAVNCSDCGLPVSAWWEVGVRKICLDCVLHEKYHEAEEKHKKYHEQHPEKLVVKEVVK